jgi:predicted DNA-binding transcriptional regulator AlpA
MQQIIINGMTASDFSELLRGIIREELQVIHQKLETESRKDLMSINEFCSEYGLSKSVVYTRTSQRTNPHLKIGGRIYFSRKAIKEWLEGMEIEPLPRIDS